MRFRPSHSLLPMLVAAVVALMGFEATSHLHAPKPDGWHESGPHGDAAHDEEFSSCAICRLAHETSSAPITPGTAAGPLPRVAPPARDASSLVATAPARDHSPRAPPCIASC